jgi:D-alanyl-D-alanine carboxypeptidase (penicillin-binding protein 5/6)
MKKYIFALFLTAVLTAAVAVPCGYTAFAETPECAYKALYVADYDTGTVISSENADARYPIASMVKIMTLTLAFEEIDKGKMSFDETVTVSDYAAHMGGSQMFLDANAQYKIYDLMKGVAVCSANDAAVALAERISGNISSFVDKMNAYAKEIGMNDTLFCNATGLPDSGEQYSTARDVTTMMRKLLSHPRYYEFSKIWMEDFTHPSGRVTEMVNTNKLIRIMSECDAGKTGFTNEAGFCLSASAKAGETRVVATILGCDNGKARFNKVAQTLRYALGKYETKTVVNKGDAIPYTAEVAKAKSVPSEVYCGSDIKIFHEKAVNDNYSVDIEFYDDLVAPVSGETPIGEIKLIRDGENVQTAYLYARDGISRATYGDSIKRVIENWFLAKING